MPQLCFAAAAAAAIAARFRRGRRPRSAEVIAEYAFLRQLYSCLSLLLLGQWEKRLKRRSFEYRDQAFYLQEQYKTAGR